MKKILVLSLVLIMSGCSLFKESEDVDYLRYKDSLSLIENAPSFIKSSDFFKTHLEITTNDTGFSYYLIIDEPKNAMYNVSVLMMIDGVTYDDNTMAPSFGIFGNERTNLVPNQLYVEGGFAKGIVVNGISNTDDFTIKAMVSWSDENSENTYHEYLELVSLEDGVINYE